VHFVPHAVSRVQHDDQSCLTSLAIGQPGTRNKKLIQDDFA